MSKLPEHLPPLARFQQPTVRSAYGICLDLEEQLMNEIATGNDYEARSKLKKDLIFCRIFGYLIHHVPNDQGLKIVVTEIVSCAGSRKALLELGKIYYDQFLRVFRSNAGRTPELSNHPSQPSFNTVVDMINDTLEEAPQNQATAKKQALARDGYRCVVTKIYDLDSVRQNKELLAEEKSQFPRRTHLAHIISESVNSGLADEHKRNRASSIWPIMQQFGYEKLPEELNGSKIHRLENVITLLPEIHDHFDRLELWFTKTNEPNKYKLEGREEIFTAAYPKYVTFTSTRPDFPLPSPDYLSFHAACAKIAHLSGATEYIEKIFREKEDVGVLSEDGSSADMLEHALVSGAHRPILA